MNHLQHTDRITLQLSSLCNYSHQHVKCPAHNCKEHRVLSSAIVHDVIDTAAEWGYGTRGVTRLAWHIYNEPLIDPRLSEFVRYARKALPTTIIIAWTNGWYLTPEILEHLIDAGVNCWRLTAYSQNEAKRFELLADGCSLPRKNLIIMQGALDDRLTSRGGGGVCHAPFRDLCIYPSGYIGLCCMDCRRLVTFADLNQVRFAQAMADAHAEMSRVHRDLLAGQRHTVACHRCSRGR